MAWVSIDDQFHDHPKAEQVGPLGRDLYVAGLEYANRNLTDGFIPKATAGRLVSFYEIPGINVTVNPYDVVKLLLDAGLWDAIDGGFEIHDYLEYQPSADEVSRRRELKRERQNRWREKQEGDTTSISNEGDVTVDASTDGLQDVSHDAQTQDPRPKTQVIPKPRDTTERAKSSQPDPSREAEQVADILVLASWINDDPADVARAVERAFSLAPQFNTRDGPLLAEQHIGWHKYAKKPPSDWYQAWLNWIKREAKDDAITGHQPRENGRVPSESRAGSGEDFDTFVGITRQA